MNRRDFLQKARDRAAMAAPLIGAAGVAGANLYDELRQSLQETAASLQSSIERGKIATQEAVERIDRIEFQQQIIFALLILSFLIDGGQSWFLFSPDLILTTP